MIMQINNIYGPSFGECEFNRAAYKIVEKLPKTLKSQIYRGSDSIGKTKYWNLYVATDNQNRFFMSFINKMEHFGDSFFEKLIPFQLIKNEISATPDKIYPTNSNAMLHLKFPTEQRAKEVYEQLKQPEPETNVGLFKRSVQTIQILEESYNYTNSLSLKNKEKPSLLSKIYAFLGIKK